VDDCQSRMTRKEDVSFKGDGGVQEGDSKKDVI